MLRAIVSMAVVCVIAVTAVAETGPPADINERTEGASRIVVARVVDLNSRFASNQFGDQLIVSSVLLDVEETLKGPVRAQLRTEIEGGTVGDLTLRVSDTPQLTAGDRAVFFFTEDAGERLSPWQRGRGILKLTDDDRLEDAGDSLDEIRSAVRASIARGGR